jgi:hypothetical protein
VSSVRIESSAFGDDRFEMLARKAGLADADHARGKMARLWRQCTIEQRHILTVEEIALVLGDSGADALIIARLGVRDDGGIRICGTRGRIEWLEKLKENGKKGGRPKKTKRFPSGSEKSNPLTLTLSPAPAHEISDLPLAPARDPAVRTPVHERAEKLQNAPGATEAKPPPPAHPAELHGLLEHAVQRLDAARRELDPASKPIGSSLSMGAQHRSDLVARLMAVDQRERRAALDHCLGVLIAEAKAKADVQHLRIGMLAGERSWERLRMGTVDSVTRSGQGARASPRGQRRGELTGLDALMAQVAEEKSR